MTRVDIENGLRKHCGADWINKECLAKYMGVWNKSPHLRQAVAGAAKIGQKFSIVDVSYNIFNMQETNA